MAVDDAEILGPHSPAGNRCRHPHTALPQHLHIRRSWPPIPAYSDPVTPAYMQVHGLRRCGIPSSPYTCVYAGNGSHDVAILAPVSCTQAEDDSYMRVDGETDK